jgi:phage shock protein C
VTVSNIRKFTLDKPRSKWLGVCSGIADYTGIDVTIVRIATALGTVLLWGGLLIVYLIVALVADSKGYSA